ncbi:type I-C CRISPR-associated protein Cas8c/Csd1 [Oceanidesulfovibrio indonesiensis]|uniref:Type I-C CRISPR-associated protein Cas8c/Csd1 n=2 Tax=Oceanidesulfovibrio indonesiensis TaxID=54767 RepID=A0A7M3MA82_9BACT|nr:type I-C CRISPR-associated protein Cas8c/Csd1 [Oceanidesulfovibrio indonesiensis]
MILQALANYYDRLVKAPDQDVPEPGFSVQKIHAEIVLDKDGNLVAMNDIQQEETIPPKTKKGKPKTKIVPRKVKVPFVEGRTSGVAAFFLWDNTGYVLGAQDKGKPERIVKQFEAFRNLAHEVLDDVEDEGARAVITFLDSREAGQTDAIEDFEEKFIGNNCVFRLDGEPDCFIHDHPAVRTAWLKHIDKSIERPTGVCLISGQADEPQARIHPVLKGVRGAQTSGAYIVSFNASAFMSYGKEYNDNAPVSERAAFAYTTALNHLLNAKKTEHQRMLLGDATVVFWSETPTRMESVLQMFIDPGAAAEDEGQEAHDGSVIGQLRTLLQAVRDGKEPPVTDLLGDEPDTPFYVLGLAPNASRLAVRFWLVSTVADIAERLAQHFDDLEMETQFDFESEFPGIWRLVLELAPARPNAEGRYTSKMDDVPPVYAGALARSVFTGEAYPESIVNRILGRFRSDGRVTHGRMALLAAHHRRALRKGRTLNIDSITKPSEVTVSLNPETKNVGYRLGRLFAVLEKAQQEALGNVNATIKDRFFGSAMATPATVFPRLLDLGQKHIAKAEYGHVMDRHIGEIMEGFEVADGTPPFPAHLSSDDQVMFALGYYHQRNALWRKKDKSPDAPQKTTGTEEAA